LGVLPEKELPQVEEALVEHLTSEESYDVTEKIAGLIYRYASPTVEAKVIAFLDPSLGKMACTV